MDIFDNYSDLDDDEQNHSLSDQMEKAEKEIMEQEQCKDQLLRSLAENENLRKRYRREVEDAHKYAIRDFINRILPVKDSLEKGIDIAYVDESIDAETLFEGMNATLKLMNGAFKYAGLEEIDPVGKRFDPEYHEAMAIRKAENIKPNQVLCVFQKGYLLNGRLVRPARVEVSA